MLGGIPLALSYKISKLPYSGKPTIQVQLESWSKYFEWLVLYVCCASKLFREPLAFDATWTTLTVTPYQIHSIENKIVVHHVQLLFCLPKEKPMFED